MVILTCRAVIGTLAVAGGTYPSYPGALVETGVLEMARWSSEARGRANTKRGTGLPGLALLVGLEVLV
jgi:hypothetical protein